MTETFTLAHLSDVHLGPVTGFEPRYWNVKRVLGYVNWLRLRQHVHRSEIARKLIADAEGLRVDHIAITGDLTNLGLPGEHEAALEWLRTVGPPEHVTVIPGNHDIYSAIRGDRGITRWAPYMGAEDETLAFPFVRRIGPIALIGLNSAVETPPFVASGRLGPNQIDVIQTQLEKLGEDGMIRVVLIHHPPLGHLAGARRGLTDAPHFVRLIERTGAELVLYGHNHKPAVDWIETRTLPVPVVGAASASAAAPHKADPLASYNLFTFFKSPNGLRIRHVVRGLEKADGPVTKLSGNILEPPQ